jgi:hypothetical protein
MAETTGPISTLPGHGHDLPEGQMCDEHEDRPAVARVQGETDSMGAELMDMCQECLNQYKEERKTADTSGKCDWCGKHAEKRREARDYEEGMNGPVYDVCQTCIDKREAEAAAYLASHENDDDFYDDPIDDEVYDSEQSDYFDGD